jgi:hypothetical protein
MFHIDHFERFKEKSALGARVRGEGVPYRKNT